MKGVAKLFASSVYYILFITMKLKWKIKHYFFYNSLTSMKKQKA